MVVADSAMKNYYCLDLEAAAMMGTDSQKAYSPFHTFSTISVQIVAIWIHNIWQRDSWLLGVYTSLLVTEISPNG